MTFYSGICCSLYDATKEQKESLQIFLPHVPGNQQGAVIFPLQHSHL